MFSGEILGLFINTVRHSRAGGNHAVLSEANLKALCYPLSKGSGLPRLTAADGLFLLAWPKRNKNPRLASFLVKSYGNLDSGSIEALSPCFIPSRSL